MKKKGQIDLSFGFIFGIILIVIIIAVAFYVISYFLSLSRCSDAGLFYNNLQDEIDKAWAGGGSLKVFTDKLPSNLQSVCFGNLTLGNPLVDSRNQYEALSIFKNGGFNTFLYPTNKACASLAKKKLSHIKVDRFFCVNVQNSQASLNISKNTSDALLTLSK
jgi:hypothetical protein